MGFLLRILATLVCFTALCALNAGAATPTPAPTPTPTPTPTPLPPVTVLAPTFSVSPAPPGAPGAAAVRDGLRDALNGTFQYAAVEQDAPPANGDMLVTVIRLDGSTNPHVYLDLTDISMPSGSTVVHTSVDVTGRNAPFVTQADVLSALKPATVVRTTHPNVVIINDGLQDIGRTAGTSFSGTAYFEARLQQELAYLGWAAMPISEFLAGSQSTNVALSTSNEDAFKAACVLDRGLRAAVYQLNYEESVNPLWGTQNGSAVAVVRLVRCGESISTAKAFPLSAKAKDFGNSGLLNLQYFNLANWLLTAGRKNPAYRGFLGTTGTIASSLMPSIPLTSAETQAVGTSARKSACTVAMLLYGQEVAYRQLQQRGIAQFHDICQQALDELNKQTAGSTP